MSHLDYVAIQPLLIWLCHKRDDADEHYEKVTGPTHFYWLGKWAALEEVMDFLEKGADEANLKAITRGGGRERRDRNTYRL